jgi:hypothetical protein
LISVQLSIIFLIHNLWYVIRPHDHTQLGF